MTMSAPGVLALVTLLAAGCTGRSRTTESYTATVEYQMQLPPGVDPGQVRWGLPGIDFVEIERSGDLVMHAGPRTTRRHRPRAYQLSDAGRHDIDARFALDKAGNLHLEMGPYDPSRPVVIDPFAK